MKNANKSKVLIIGAGLAGSECALVLSKFNNFEITLIDQKPLVMSSCHTSSEFGELVCSNSLRSKNITTGAGLIKQELSLLSSPLLEIAYECEIDTGDSLVVDRSKFSSKITEKIKNNSGIKINSRCLTTFDVNLDKYDYVVIATGPATSHSLFNSLCDFVGSTKRYFIDGSAPLIEADSIDFTKTFWQNRFDRESGEKYLNCPLDKEQYEMVCNKLVLLSQDCSYLNDPLFQGCMPLELIARSGVDSLRFGPLKPIGLGKFLTKKPYAIVQLRQDNYYKSLYNLVGFQTGLTEPKQREIIHMIPGLEKAKIAKYGRLHHSLFIDSPRVLQNNYQTVINHKVYFAGQINGIEGYAEAIASGHLVALDILFREKNTVLNFPQTTMIAALANYAINKANTTYTPIKSNFGILPPLLEDCHKSMRKELLAKRSLHDLEKFLEEHRYG